MSARQGAPVEWLDWVWWVLASTVGGATGFVLSMTVLDLLRVDLGRALEATIIYGLFWIGAGIGQWFVLRRRVPRAGYWIAASAVGGVLTGGGAVIWPNPSNLLVAFVGMGTLLGVAQWLVLRRDIRRAGWWLLARPAGCALGVLLVQVLDRLLVSASISEMAGLVIGFGTMSGVAAVVTGGVLIWLFSQTPPGQHTKGREQVNLLTDGEKEPRA